MRIAPSLALKGSKWPNRTTVGTGEVVNHPHPQVLNSAVISTSFFIDPILRSSVSYDGRRTVGPQEGTDPSLPSVHVNTTWVIYDLSIFELKVESSVK